MDFSQEERPIGIQIFGHDEESMRKATLMVEKKKPEPYWYKIGDVR